MERIKLDIQKFAEVTSDSVEGRYLKLSVWEESTSIPNNTSTVKWKLESIGGSSLYYTIYNCSVSVTYAKNSSDTTVTETVANYGTVTWDERRFPATTGSVEGTITVQHKNNGTALPVNFTLHGKVYYSGDDNRSGTLNLSTIPRYFTQTPSITKTGETETTQTFNWSTSEVCSQIKVYKEGSLYTTISTNSTSGSFTVSGLNANTSYSTYGEFKRSDSGLTTNSNTITSRTYDFPYCINSPDFTIGTPLTLSFYNPLNRSISITGIGNDGSTIFTGTTTGTSLTGFNDSTSANNQYNSIPNSNSGIYQVRVIYGSSTKTRNNGNKYYTNYNDCSPIFENFTFNDTNSTTVTLTGGTNNNVNNYSNIRVSIPTNYKATARKGATMSKYRFVCGNSFVETNYSDDDTVYMDINKAPTGVYQVYAIDSRGNSTLVQRTATSIINYVDVYLNNSSYLERNDNGVGGQVTLNYNGTFWNGNFGSVTNSIKSTSYKFKKTSSNTWITGTSDITPTVSNNGFSFEDIIKSDNEDYSFDIDSSYNIQVIVTDELSTYVLNLILNSGTPNLAYADEGVAVMGDYDDSLDSGLQVYGKLFLNKVEVAPIYLGEVLENTTTTLTIDYRMSILFLYNTWGDFGVYLLDRQTSGASYQVYQPLKTPSTTTTIASYSTTSIEITTGQIAFEAILLPILK